MTLYAFDDVDDALDATRSFLWPFDLGTWLKLALVTFFVGGTGAVNPAQFANTPSTGTPSDPGAPGTPTLSEIVNSISPTEWAIIGVVVGVILLIGFALAFVGAVMEFVFLESIRHERVSIREYWGERWRQGGRLFGFRFVVGLLSLVVAGGAILAAIWPLLTGNGAFSVPLLLAAIGVAVVVAMVSGLVNGFTTQFVVPVMIAEDRTVLGAWRRFWPTLTGQWKQYLAYAFMRIVLSIAVGIVVGIVTGIAALVIAIPFVIVGIVGGYLVLAMGTPLVGGAIVAVAILLFTLLIVVVSLLVAVPVQTYLRYYALLVLGDTEDAFDLVPERRRAIRE